MSQIPARPPRPPPPRLPGPTPLVKKLSGGSDLVAVPKEDLEDLFVWWRSVKAWTYLPPNTKVRDNNETQLVKDKAMDLYKAIQIYIVMVSLHIGSLEKHTEELLCIADNLDKVSRSTKIAGITGGATGVAGGVAAAAGVAMAPFTGGVSLAITAVGVGVATAGGVTGASAAIVNKVNVTHDKKKIEKIFEDYQSVIEEIQKCLKFIDDGMLDLRQYDLDLLSEAGKGADMTAKVVQFAIRGGRSTRALEVNSEVSGMLQGLAIGINIHFTQGKKGQQLKKGHGSKLARKIRSLVENLNNGMDELKKMNESFTVLFVKN